MSQADIEAEQRKFLEGWEEMRAFEAAGPAPRQKRVIKREITPTFRRYVDTIWRPQQLAKIKEAASRDALGEIKVAIREGINVDAYDYNHDVFLYRVEAFFPWLLSNPVGDDGNGSTAHWPTRAWREVTNLLVEEKRTKIIKAQDSSERVRRKAINGLLEGGLKQADIDKMGLRIKWDNQASTSATSSDGNGAAGSSKAAAATNPSGSNSSSSNGSKRKRKREGEE